MTGPLSATRGGVLVMIRVTPRARGDRIDGLVATADGRTALKVFVSAPPADNAANTAVLRLLAREWRLRPGDLDIAAGAASRNKIVRVAGSPNDLLEHLGAAIAALAPTR